MPQEPLFGHSFLPPSRSDSIGILQKKKGTRTGEIENLSCPAETAALIHAATRRVAGSIIGTHGSLIARESGST